MCNNAVTRLDTPKGEPPAYVMAIESNMGKEYLQATFAFLNSSDLSTGWTQFDPKIYHYTDREYSACPTIRHFDGWFYVASKSSRFLRVFFRSLKQRLHRPVLAVLRQRPPVPADAGALS